VVGDGVVAHTVVTGMAAGANGGPGTYTVNVPQDVLECPLGDGLRGAISGTTLTVTSDAHPFSAVLSLYASIKKLLVVEKSAAPGSPIAAQVAEQLSRAKEAIKHLGFNTARTVSAFSESLLPPSQLPYFSWGGGVRALCGNPLLVVFFELLHTVQLGLHRTLFSFVLVAISRSRGLDRGGAVLPGGGDAYRLFDSLIRRVPAFSDGVREHTAVWSNGVSKKGSSFFTGRAYSSLLAPLLACLCPTVLPDRTLRRQLITLLEYGLWFFTVARNPSSYYGGLAATAELLGKIASTIDSYLSATVGGRAFKKGGDDGWLRRQPRTARLPRAFTPVHRPLQTFPPLSSTKCAWITLPFS